MGCRLDGRTYSISHHLISPVLRGWSFTIITVISVEPGLYQFSLNFVIFSFVRDFCCEHLLIPYSKKLPGIRTVFSVAFAKRIQVSSSQVPVANQRILKINFKAKPRDFRKALKQDSEQKES